MAAEGVRISQGVRNAFHVVLDRPKALHALSLGMVRQMLPVYRGFLRSPPRCVVLASTTPKAFCAGGDVRGIISSREEQIRFWYEEYQLDCAIGALRAPHVALIDGICMGGGMGISMHGSHRVATPTTTVAMPETAIGLFPDVGGTFVLPRLPGGPGLGMYLALTGARLKGADVVHAGLATHLAPSSAAAASIAADLVTNGAEVDPTLAAHCTPAAALPPFSLAPRRAAIEETFGAGVGSVEAVVAALTRLQGGGGDDAKFAGETIATLARQCPLSLKITFEALRRGAAAPSLAAALVSEYRLTQRICFDPRRNFHRGVTALLVDKSPTPPPWDPPTLEAVGADDVAAFFAPPEGKEYPKGGFDDWVPATPAPAL